MVNFSPMMHQSTDKTHPHLLSGPSLRRVHRSSALVIAAFVILHFANHLAGLAGQDAHRSVQHVLRLAYQGWLEPALLACCAVQIATGVRLVWQRRYHFWHRAAQPVTGLYLAIFLCIHLFAVMQARYQGVETDLAFAAAGMHAGAWAWFFALYYGLAVLAFGWHISVPIGRRNPTLGRALIFLSAALAVAFVALLAGWITPLRIAPELIQAFPQ